MKKIFFNITSTDRNCVDVATLFLRLFAGCMMLTHGWAKLTMFSTLAHTFPDPLGLGSTTSLILILFAEVGCSVLLILGLVTRLATLPLIFGMLVAIFAIHGADPFSARELPVLYLGMYIVLLLIGGGRFSVDEVIRYRLKLTR